MQVPAVVGSWPEPFAQASASGDRRPVRWSAWPPAARATPRLDRLAGAGVDASVERVGGALAANDGPSAPGRALGPGAR